MAGILASGSLDDYHRRLGIGCTGGSDRAGGENRACRRPLDYNGVGNRGRLHHPGMERPADAGAVVKRPRGGLEFRFAKTLDSPWVPQPLSKP
jgi:hypothetical protein